MKFIKGDIVRCLDNSGWAGTLKNNKCYMVTLETYSNNLGTFIGIHVPEMTGTLCLLPYRFELVSRTELSKALYV